MMTLKTVAVMSPGDMGEGVGASIRGQGIDVITVLAGRSDETRMRAERAGFRDVQRSRLWSRKPTCAVHHAAGARRKFRG